LGSDTLEIESMILEVWEDIESGTHSSREGRVVLSEQEEERSRQRGFVGVRRLSVANPRILSIIRTDPEYSQYSDRQLIPMRVVNDIQDRVRSGDIPETEEERAPDTHPSPATVNLGGEDVPVGDTSIEALELARELQSIRRRQDAHVGPEGESRWYARRDRDERRAEEIDALLEPWRQRSGQDEEVEEEIESAEDEISDEIADISSDPEYQDVYSSEFNSAMRASVGMINSSGVNFIHVGTGRAQTPFFIALDVYEVRDPETDTEDVWERNEEIKLQLGEDELDINSIMILADGRVIYEDEAGDHGELTASQIESAELNGNPLPDYRDLARVHSSEHPGGGSEGNRAQPIVRDRGGWEYILDDDGETILVVNSPMTPSVSIENPIRIERGSRHYGEIANRMKQDEFYANLDHESSDTRRGDSEEEESDAGEEESVPTVITQDSEAYNQVKTDLRTYVLSNLQQLDPGGLFPQSYSEDASLADLITVLNANEDLRTEFIGDDILRARAVHQYLPQQSDGDQGDEDDQEDAETDEASVGDLARHGSFNWNKANQNTWEVNRNQNDNGSLWFYRNDRDAQRNVSMSTPKIKVRRNSWEDDRGGIRSYDEPSAKYSPNRSDWLDIPTFDQLERFSNEGESSLEEAVVRKWANLVGIDYDDPYGQVVIREQRGGEEDAPTARERRGTLRSRIAGIRLSTLEAANNEVYQVLMDPEGDWVNERGRPIFRRMVPAHVVATISTQLNQPYDDILRDAEIIPADDDHSADAEAALAVVEDLEELQDEDLDVEQAVQDADVAGEGIVTDLDGVYQYRIGDNGTDIWIIRSPRTRSTSPTNPIVVSPSSRHYSDIARRMDEIDPEGGFEGVAGQSTYTRSASRTSTSRSSTASASEETTSPESEAETERTEEDEIEEVFTWVDGRSRWEWRESSSTSREGEFVLLNGRDTLQFRDAQQPYQNQQDRARYKGPGQQGVEILRLKIYATQIYSSGDRNIPGKVEISFILSDESVLPDGALAGDAWNLVQEGQFNATGDRGNWTEEPLGGDWMLIAPGVGIADMPTPWELYKYAQDAGYGPYAPGTPETTAEKFGDLVQSDTEGDIARLRGEEVNINFAAWMESAIEGDTYYDNSEGTTTVNTGDGSREYIGLTDADGEPLQSYYEGLKMMTQFSTPEIINTILSEGASIDSQVSAERIVREKIREIIAERRGRGRIGQTVQQARQRMRDKREQRRQDRQERIETGNTGRQARVADRRERSEEFSQRREQERDTRQVAATVARAERREDIFQLPDDPEWSYKVVRGQWYSRRAGAARWRQIGPAELGRERYERAVSTLDQAFPDARSEGDREMSRAEIRRLSRSEERASREEAEAEEEEQRVEAGPQSSDEITVEEDYMGDRHTSPVTFKRKSNGDWEARSVSVQIGSGENGDLESSDSPFRVSVLTLKTNGNISLSPSVDGMSEIPADSSVHINGARINTTDGLDDIWRDSQQLDETFTRMQQLAGIIKG